MEHPTGASDVVLRLTEGGGLMFPEIRAIDAPVFTLYGDGRFILKPASDAPPPIGAPGPDSAQPAWRTAVLSEGQVQLLLAEAADILGPARPRYELNTVMDAPTTTFFVDAGGGTKTVEVYALGLEEPDNPDARARSAFKALADELRALDRGGQLATDIYQPGRYRGTLFESGPVVGPTVQPWPWTDLTPDDFTAPVDPDGLALPSRIMSAAEIGRLGLDDVGGGVTGLYLKGPGAQGLYAFGVRPLLPDED